MNNTSNIEYNVSLQNHLGATEVSYSLYRNYTEFYAGTTDKFNSNL